VRFKNYFQLSEIRKSKINKSYKNAGRELRKFRKKLWQQMVKWSFLLFLDFLKSRIEINQII